MDVKVSKYADLSHKNLLLNAFIAQLAERVTFNHVVSGSSPDGGIRFLFFFVFLTFLSL